MAKIEFKQRDKYIDMIVDDTHIDSHFMCDEDEELNRRKAYMFFKHFRWSALEYAGNISVGVFHACRKAFFEDANGEVMSDDYLSFQRPVMADEDWNTALAIRLGYKYYQECMKANFNASTAAPLAFARAYLSVIKEGESEELQSILKMKVL